MKKNIKLICAVGASLLLLLCGACTPAATSSGTASGGADNSGLPRMLEIISSDFFYSATDSTVEDRNEWTETLSNRYGVEISVTVPVEETYIDMMDKALDGTYSGIAKLDSYSSLLYFIEKGAILPLDDYLANNTAWLMLPEQMRQMYEIDGHIWAVPSSFYYEIDTRGFRTDWLEALEMQTPTTVEEFRQFALAVADSDSIEGTAVAAARDLSWAIDILEAYGLHIDESGQLPYAYDPELDSIADALLKPEAEQALTLLRELYESGAIYAAFETLSNSDLSEQMLTDGFGTAAANVSDMKYYYGLYSKAEQIYAQTSDWPSTATSWSTLTSMYEESVLTGTATENVQTIYPMSDAYVLLKNTAQPTQTINFFVDLLFASEDNYLEAAVGLSQNYVKNADGTITLKSKLDVDASEEMETSVYVPRVQANLVGRIDGLYASSSAHIINSTDESVIQHRLEVEEYEQRMLNEALTKKLVVKEPMKYSSPNSSFLVANTTEIATAFKNCFMNAITNPQKTVRQALDEYKIAMAELGAEQVLDEANAAIGKNRTQSYN